MSIEMLGAASAEENRESARAHDEQLQEALDRVFNKYGSDLSSFFRDVTEEVSARQHVKLDISKAAAKSQGIPR